MFEDMVVRIVHDDVLFLGQADLCLKIIEEIKIKMKTMQNDLVKDIFEIAEELDPNSAHYHRSEVGKLMCVAWDCSDIQFGTGTASRGESRPTPVSDMRVKRVA